MPAKVTLALPLECHTDCKTCTGPNNDQCTSCSSSEKVLQNQRCGKEESWRLWKVAAIVGGVGAAGFIVWVVRSGRCCPCLKRSNTSFVPGPSDEEVADNEEKKVSVRMEVINTSPVRDTHNPSFVSEDNGAENESPANKHKAI
eukprot:TRINITY_DN11094_c0_g1_i2.p2 TRINITY_DN11094_c0_g1~~TRINITY_DN11094_c0_g1_i2.p2  ORF type:complete len:144 (+),score=11.24 TRINITY_DN11094_c0_g1_i2:569-1000(+)